MKNFLVAISLFISWTISFSIGNVLLLLILVATHKRLSKNRPGLIVLLVILLVSYINLLFGIFSSKTIDEGSSIFQLYFPYIGLLVGSYFLADHVNARVLEMLIILVLIECVAVVYQYSLGLTGFAYNSYVANDNLSEMLYYTRPNGLSTNSSVVGQKLLFAIWTLLTSKHVFTRFRFFAWLLLMVCMFLVFNRTVFLALAISVLLSKRLLTFKTKLSLTALVSFTILTNIDRFKHQFLRGDESLNIENLTRYRVYSNGLDYISDHVLLGNNGVKYFYLENGRYFHLHNSYLETAASNGLPILILVMVLLFVLMYRRNSYVLPLSVYSLLQFGVFWGISFFDVLLFVNYEKEAKENSR